MLKNKLEEIKKSVIEMGNYSLTMTKNAIAPLAGTVPDKAREKMNEMEDVVNSLELVIDEKCISGLACYQPEGGNLRRILMYNKMANDLACRCHGYGCKNV